MSDNAPAPVHELVSERIINGHRYRIEFWSELPGFESNAVLRDGVVIESGLRMSECRELIDKLAAG